MLREELALEFLGRQRFPDQPPLGRPNFASHEVRRYTRARPRAQSSYNISVIEKIPEF
jgi:hypothetical protein